MPLRGMSFANESVNCLDEDSTPRKPLKRRPSPTINTKAALDDIIDIFSQPLKSQQELDEAEDSSSDDDSDATSLTSRSFGNQSDIEEPPIEEEPQPELPPSTEEEEQPLQDEVSTIEVSNHHDTLQILEQEQYKNFEDLPLPQPIPSSSSDVTPPQYFVFPQP